MKKKILILSFLWTYWSVQAQTPQPNKPIPATSQSSAITTLSADQVLANYVKAIGGKENLMKIRDLTFRMTATAQGVEVIHTQQQKIPNKIRIRRTVPSMNMDVMTAVFDGVTMQVTYMGQKQPIEGKLLQDSKIRSTLFPELHYDQLGVKRTLAGIEKVGSADAYKVVLETPSGSQATEFYDTNTFLKLKQVMSGEMGSTTVTQTTLFSDYRDINSIKFPYKLQTLIGSQDIPWTVTSVETNTNLSDESFEVK